MAITPLVPTEIEQVSGGALLTPLVPLLGIGPNGLFGGGGGTLGLGGLFRGLFTQIPGGLGKFLIALEAAI